MKIMSLGVIWILVWLGGCHSQSQEELLFKQVGFTTQKNIVKLIDKELQSGCAKHITEEIINDLGQSEKHLKLRMYTIKNGDEHDKLKAYYLFGEHPRELISSELALYFIKDLCSRLAQNDATINHLLNKYVIYIVVDANPLGRNEIDSNHKFCQRMNENDVDLNRNYDAGWESNNGSDDQTNSGSQPFSEPQTKTFRDHILDKNINLFLTVHSGAYGLYTPHAYSVDPASNNQNNIESINNQMNDQFCKCDHGIAGKLVGYLCPGTCLDYAYDKKNVLYSYAWEIFDRDTPGSSIIDKMREFPNPQPYVSRSIHLQRLKSQSNVGKMLKSVDTKLKFNKKNKKGSFIQLKDVLNLNMNSQIKTQLTSTFNSKEKDNDECFTYFNPRTVDQKNWTLKHFTNALYALMDLTEITIKDKGSSGDALNKINAKIQGIEE